MPDKRTGELGFTLIELIVVLAILAILATLAMTATSGIVDQTRYEKTIQAFDLIEQAVFGKVHSDGPSYGFIADMGSFPMSTKELTAQYGQDGIPDTSDDPPDFQPDITTGLVSGWNGPYIQPPDNSEESLEVLDGWGNPPGIFPRSRRILHRRCGRGGNGGLGSVRRLEPEVRVISADPWYT